MNRLADVQFRLFTAQVSYAYLHSLAQPPTPLRNQRNTHVNTTGELKELQKELDALVFQCKDAIHLIAKQYVTEKVANATLQGRVNCMERQLDAVQCIEDTLDGMIGRVNVTRNLLLHEISKLEALSQILDKLRNHAIADVSKPPPSEPVLRPAIDQVHSPQELESLRNLIGITDMDDVQKIRLKAERLDRELVESSLRMVNETIDEA